MQNRSDRTPTAMAPRAGVTNGFRASRELIASAKLLAIAPIGGYAGDGEMDWTELESAWTDLISR